jgi:hypothetical protein
LELGEGEGGAALGDAPAEGVGGGLEGAEHGAGDYEVDVEGELFEGFAEGGALEI